MPQDTKFNTPSQGYTGTAETSVASVASSVRDEAARLKDEAARQGAAAYDSLKQGARSLGGEARERATRYAAEQKDAVSSHLDDFAHAIRQASDDLNQRDQTMAAQFVRQAAGGLESLSRSVSGASFEDMIDSVRRFGRNNPAAFIGGAVLAGLALGRFARASGHRDDDYDYNADYGDGGDWRGEGDEEFAPSPYRGSSYSAGDRASFSSASRGAGDMPPPSQGYAGGGMGRDPVQSSTPSSATDPSVSATPQTGGTAAQPGAISTGDRP